MKKTGTKLFSNFSSANWQKLALFAAICFYFFLFCFTVLTKGFASAYGGDYLAFRSVGKIAAEKGYAAVYDLENLRLFQTQEISGLGLLLKDESQSYTPFPVPFLSIFILPFQLLAEIPLVAGYWIWTVLNMVLLFAYLYYFMKKTHPGEGFFSSRWRILILVIFSFPIFSNMIQGQVNLFLMIFTGEFFRLGIARKPVLAGLWLGGLLLKPQLLILVLPLLLIQKNWKALKGFVISSGFIVAVSYLISGLDGMKSMLALWTGWGAGNTTNSPANMINWRMVGVSLGTLSNAQLGWIIAVMGTVLTLAVVYLLIKKRPEIGSPSWALAMLGIFSATLAVTWHSHYAMAVVLVPLLVYAASFKLLPVKPIFWWMILTPASMFGGMILSVLILMLAKVNLSGYQGMVTSFSGFIANLILLYAAAKSRGRILLLDPT